MDQNDEPDRLRAAAAHARRLAGLLSSFRDREALEQLARDYEDSARRIAFGAHAGTGHGGGPDGAASGMVHGPDRA